MSKILQSVPYPTYTTAERDALVDVLQNYKINNSDTGVVEEWDGSTWSSGGNSGGLTPEQEQIIADAEAHIDGADEAKHGTNQIVNAAALSNLSTPENAPVDDILSALNVKLSTLALSLRQSLE